jgi:predicted methyltransferase
MRTIAPIVAALALALPLGAPLAAKEITDSQALAVVLADTKRDGDRVRDQYRHPSQTLALCKVRPGQTVVDYMPSSGWWTRILVPYLGEKGRYVGLNPDVSKLDDRMKQYFGNLGGTFPAKVNEWTGASGERVAAYNTDGLPATLKGKVNRVLIMREMHNLWRMNLLRGELMAVRDLLDDDGRLCIEQHRARKDSRAAYTDGSKGYMRPKDVIALVEAHGFELEAASEINANKKDPANHEAGVWVLPPNFRSVEDPAERARYTAIGESDRMTLVFRKRR